MIEKATKKFISLLATFLIVFSSLMQNPIATQEFISNIMNPHNEQSVGLTAHGAALNVTTMFGYNTSRVDFRFANGNTTYENGALKFTINGEPVFCIEPMIIANSGDGYTSSTLTPSGITLRTGFSGSPNPKHFTAQQIQEMAKWVHFGYKDNRTDLRYYYTQWRLWELVLNTSITYVGYSLGGASLPGFKTWKAETQAKIDAAANSGGGTNELGPYYPEWDGDSKKIGGLIGSTLTLTDKTGNAAHLNNPISLSSGGITWTKSGSNWTASIPSNIKDGRYSFQFSGSTTSTTPGTGGVIDKGSTIIWKSTSGRQTIGQLYANIEKKPDTTIRKYEGAITLDLARDYTPKPLRVKFDHNGNPLGGATFQVTQKGANGNTVITPYQINSDSNGQLTFKSMNNASNGSIEIREVSAPAGYDLDPNTYTIKLDSQGQIIASTVPKIVNKPSNGEIFIEKSKFDGTNTTIGAGFIFDILDNSGNVVKTLTTDSNGKAKSGSLKLGTYTIKERATAGYKLLPPQEVTITPAARTITYKATNESTTRKLQLVKYDSATDKTIAYEGVSFDIFNKADNKKVTTITTDANGIANTGQLPLGAYYAKEVKAPYGYVLSDQPKDFTLSASTPATLVIRFDNVPQKGSLTINKTGDSIVEWKQGNNGVFTATMSEKPIQGVVFNVKDSKGVNYGEITTNASGVATLGDLPIDETYTVTEITAPNEFVKSKPVSVKISYAGQNVQVAQGTGNVHNNHKFTDLSITKEFQDANADKYAKIGLYTAKEAYGLPANSLVGLVEVNGNQKATVSNLPIDGEFYFKEIETNAAYKLNDAKFPVSTAFGSSNEAKFHGDAGKMINELIPTSLKLVKYERGSDKKITVPGAVYRLTRLSDNKVIGDYTTDNNGSITVEGLQPDKYRWLEVTAPQGYFLNSTPIDVTTQPGATAAVSVETDNEKIPTIGTTAAFDNLGKVDNPTNTLTIYDDVQYTDLVVGSEYVMNGALMHQESGKPLLDSTGKEIKSSVKFTPTTRDGVVRVEFTVDRDAVQRMRGQHITVFEWLVRDDNVELADHTDIDDSDQTVEVTDPKIVTDAAFTNGEKLYNPITNVDITDVIAYTNVLPKSNYVLDTKLIQKSGEKLIKNEKFNFTSTDKRDGKTSVTMKGIDLTKLRGQELVFYQDLLFENDLIARHANLNDARQTVRVTNPNITSNAKYVDGLKESNPVPGVEVIDVVSYKDLVPNKKYRLESSIMDVSTGKTVGLANGETRFVAKAANGTVEVKMPNLDLSKLGGKKLVIFETLFYVDDAGKEHTIAIHHDLLDKLQQIDVLNPRIKTMASYVDKLKESDPMTGVGLTDIVSYSDLVVGKKYKLDAVLMDYETGKPVNIGTGTTTFTASAKTGNVEVKFQNLDLTKLRGKNIVVFETLHYINDKGTPVVVANHHDIRDELQRVSITNPNLKTTAFFEDGRKLHEPFEKVTIHDDVAYKDLIPGKEYTMKATLMDKSTSKPIVIDGAPVTISSKFVPKAKSGTHRMTFVVNATSLVGKTTVAFEELYRDTQKVGFHTDINDAGQTVRFTNPKIGTTATFDDGTKVSDPLSKVVVHDDVKYEDLIPGKEYRMEGKIMVKSTGKELLVGGKPVTKTVTFKPTESNGTVRITYVFDAKDLQGQELVVYEKLYTGTSLVTTHEDINDKGQTVRIINPEIGTTAYYYDGTKEHEPLKQVVLKDKVDYTDLIPGHTYKMTGTVMVKETNKPLLQGGKSVVTSINFTPKESNGSVELSFNIEADKLDGKHLVVFEDLTLLDFKDTAATVKDVNKSIASHKDINDVKQTVRVTKPEVKTTAYFEDKGTVHNPNKVVKIYDDVKYTDLLPGKEYELEGTLMLKGTNKPLLQNGKPVVVRNKFTPKARDGVHRMAFEINASLVRGEDIVVFETLYHKNEEIYVHHDINDKSQTVRITNPEIGTTATFQDPIDKKKHEPLSLVKVYDRVQYKDVVAGKEYTVKGKLMNKETGKVVENSDGPVESSVTFTAENTSGYVTVVFDVEARNLRGQSVVAFETLYNSGDIMAVHEDLSDVGQTVDFTDPKIGTKANFEDGLKIHEALEEVVIYDTVEYSNLIPGKEYTMTGHLRKKSNGEPILGLDGETITTSVTFKPTAPVGAVELPFAVPAVALRGEKVVAFETLYYKGEDIAIHHDIEDEEQTVRFVDPKLSTKARFMDELQVSDPLMNTPMYDDVTYEDVVPGRTYIIRGTLIDKFTGEPFVYTDKDGEEHILQTTEELTVKEDKGVHRMKFDITLGELRDQLRDKELVVYEELFYKDQKIGNHEDIEDAEQTVRFTNPKIKTTATFDDGTKLTEPMKSVLIHDDVHYEDLIPGKEYQMTGQLMNKETGKVLMQHGEPVIQTVSFTPKEASGVVRLTFEVDARALRGKKLVAFETLSREDQELAIHHDIEDEDQTVEFTDPEIGTKAYWNDNSKEYEPIKSVILKDMVEYKNLIPGHKYVMTGKIMVKDTNSPLKQDGEEVITSVEFTPEAKDGQIELSFDIQANKLYGKELVVFETLTYKSEWMADHKDINDEGQTVRVTNPEVKTTAYFEDKGKIHNPNTKVKIYDDVEFKDLIPGKEYELEGTLMVKDTNKPLLQGDKPVVVREKFTPKTREGVYRMVFEIDASSVRGKELVVFETLYSHGQEIYVHADINDASQTVRITNPEIGTTATFQDPIDDKKHEPLTLVKVYDSVEYKDLVPGKEYTINGKLMNKEDGTPVMNEAGPVESSITFTPETPNGFATVVFEVEARNLRGKSVVAFEKLYNNGDLMAVHEDLEDVGQTVDITDPKIKTTAYFEDGLKVHEALKEVVIYDSVQYSNLIPGKEYTMSGHLRKKSDGEPLLDSKGDIINTTVKFVPEEPVGSVTLEFKVAANALRGEKVVAFETLYYQGEDIAIHHDIEDEDQTVRFINPKIGTLAKFMDELKISDPLSETPMYDDVKYEDLIAGRTYTLRGVLMDKSTGEPFIYVDDEGKESILESVEEFSPEAESGTYRMTFDVKLADLRDQLRNKELVVFEELFYKGEEIVNHKEIEDEGQTVEFTNPEIGTTAVFDDGSKLTEPMSKVTIHDDVQYKGLIPGKEYQMTGQLMSQSTGEVLVQDGEPVTQTVSFTPEKSEGVIRLTFEVDARELRGQTVVAFEELHRNGDSLAIHHDIEDENQSVSFPDPKIGTSAVFNDGTKTSDPVKDVVVIDTVSYEGLIPGHEYTINGRLMSKSTGRALIIDSHTVDSELTFTPKSESGTVDLEFKFDATELKGQELVVFEVLTHREEIMASHEDIEDKGQTVEIINPEIGTTATFDGESTKVSEPLEEVVVHDLVEYTGLIPGKEYTMSGKLMDKETGKEFVRDGKVVESTVKFTPKEADGSVMIEFKIKAKDLANKSLVAFESLISKGQEIAIHHDIEDENQTVVFTGPEIGTSAQFENGTKLANPAGEAKIIDTVSYKGLIPGHEYRLVGQMMMKSTGKPVDKSVEGVFTPESSEGYAKIEFVLNTDDLAGQELVAFEKLFLGKEEIANHEDINDFGQTVRITGPNIGTKATFDGKEEKYSDPLELVKVYDTVEYKDLIPGNKYQMRGQFMDKETGKPISRDGKVVESVLEFTPEHSRGSVVLEFEIPAKDLAGKSIVAFEWLSYEGKEIAIHTNIEDEEQTVHFRNPKIGTYASFLDNTKEQEVSKQAVIVDRVTYEGLTPGRTYTLKGQMMSKKEQKSVAQAETTFTPTSESGEVKLEFTVDSSSYADGTEIVAFEEVSFEGQVIAEHKDINDEGQTVSFKVIPEYKPEEPKPEPKPEKKPEKNHEIINPAGQFLENPFGVLIAGLGILLVVGLVVWFIIDRKKRANK